VVILNAGYLSLTGIHHVAEISPSILILVSPKRTKSKLFSLDRKFDGHITFCNIGHLLSRVYNKYKFGSLDMSNYLTQHFLFFQFTSKFPNFPSQSMKGDTTTSQQRGVAFNQGQPPWAQGFCYPQQRHQHSQTVLLPLMASRLQLALPLLQEQQRGQGRGREQQRGRGQGQAWAC
jgi:hypothetical protein